LRTLWHTLSLNAKVVLAEEVVFSDFLFLRVLVRFLYVGRYNYVEV